MNIMTQKITGAFLVLALVMITCQLQAQWQIYEANVHPSETEDVAPPLLDISVPSESSPAPTLIETVINDPDIVGNKIFKYFHFDGDGKTMYRHDFAQDASGTHMTMVARVRGSGTADPEVRAIDLQWRGAEFRDELRIWPGDSILELEKAEVEVKVDMNLHDWHIYRMEIMNDSVAVFVDEDPTPVISGKSTSNSSSRYVKFGDGSSEPTAGYLDWFILYMDSAAAPAALPIPAELTGQGSDSLRTWGYYTADVLPPDNLPPFEESNVAGDPSINEIMADPDDASNNFLKMVVAGADSRYMWKQSNGWEVDTADHVTAIMRVKGVSDTLDRTMELDLHANGLRERLYLKTDNTYELKESGIKGDMPDMLNWHTIRMTLADGEVKVYMDENPVPFVEGTTTTSTTSDYLRFGDGNGGSTLGGYVDYVVWTTDGAFPPDSVGVPLDLKTDEFVAFDRNLASLSPDVGALEPAFDPAETEYTLMVPQGTDSVTFAVAPADTSATVSGDLVLHEVPGTAVITVTAQDGSARDYTIEVTMEVSSVATLSSMTVDVGNLDPAFAAGVNAYTLEVPQGTTAVNFTAVTSDPNATVTGDGEFTNIPGTATITVTAEDGTTFIEYTIEVTFATGIDQRSVRDASVYPNPAGEFVRVTLHESFLGAGLNILDASGKVVRSVTYRSAEQLVDLSDIEPGIYLLQAESRGNTVSVPFVVE